MELSNQEIELFFHFQASNQKISFTRCFKLFARIFKTGKRIIEIGNGIISLASSPLIKKLLTKDFFYYIKEIQIDFPQEIELFEQEMELFFQIPGL